MVQKPLLVVSRVLLATLLLFPFQSLAASAPDPHSSEDNSNQPPFKPYWQNEFQLGFSSQQAGQSTTSFSYTGTHYFDEAGDFLSGEVLSQNQKVEGINSNLGGLTLEGGLGIGIFSPSLSLGAQAGQSGWRQVDTNLTLPFQIADPFSLSLALGINFGNHQGPVSQFYPSLPGTAQVDTAGLNSSLQATFVPWDWWSISLVLQGESDITYALQSINGPTVKIPVNQADQISSLTLALDFTLFKGFVLDIAPEIGREYYPAGAVYSPLTGGLVQNSLPSVQNFVSSSVAVSYSFP